VNPPWAFARSQTADAQAKTAESAVGRDRCSIDVASSDQRGLGAEGYMGVWVFRYGYGYPGPLPGVKKKKKKTSLQ
jgi:hypothetical protein